MNKDNIGIVTFITDELCKMLNISKKTLRNLSEEKLKLRVLKYGYKFVNSYKSGRNKIYELEFIGITNWETIQSKYGIKASNKDKHKAYSLTRIDTCLDATRGDTIKNSNTRIAYSTAVRYDDILLEEKIMEKDKVVYRMVNMKTNEFIPITEDEYKQFWIDHKEFKREMNLNTYRREKYELDEYAYNYLNYKTCEKFGRDESYMAIKFMTYKSAENTKRIIDELTKKTPHLTNEV